MLNIKNLDQIKIIAKPNSSKTEIKGYDKEKGAYRVNVKAPPEKGKANREIIRFFSKLTKKQVSIVTGFKSREKLLVLE